MQTPINPFKQAMAAGDVKLGLWLALADSYAAEIKARGYRLGTVFLPHDGYHKDYKTGKSAEEILKRFGFKVRQVSNTSIEAGINATPDPAATHANIP